MITVRKFGPAFGLPDASPFVCKVEAYLHLTGQKYETSRADVRKAPRQQLPVVDVDGKVIPDSTQIIQELESRRSEKMDDKLGPRDRAIGTAVKSMLEEHLYFGLLFMRWTCDDGWAVFEPQMREMLGTMGVPSLMRGMVAKTARKYTVSRTATQGLGRRPRAEVVEICAQILDATSEFLGDHTYLLGDRPSTYDATLYAFTLGALCPAFDNEVRKHAATRKNLVDYVDRIRAQYWSE